MCSSRSLEKDPKVQQKVFQYAVRETPDIIVCALPCAAFSSLQNLKQNWEGRAENIEKQQKADTEFIDFSRRLYKMQTGGGRHFLGENPWLSKAWSTTPGAAMIKELHTAKTDMCAHGLRDPEWDWPVRKRTRLVVTAEAVARELSRKCRCEEAKEKHRQIKGTWRFQGKKIAASNWAGGYCEGFCKNVLKAFAKQVERDMLDCYAANLDDDIEAIFGSGETRKMEDAATEDIEKKRRRKEKAT